MTEDNIKTGYKAGVAVNDELDRRGVDKKELAKTTGKYAW